jgi:BA14K-like protein
MKEIQNSDEIRSDAAGCIVTTDGPGMARATLREETVATDNADTHLDQQAPRRVLPWLLAIVVCFNVGALYWVNNPEKPYELISSLRSKHEPPPAPQGETTQTIAALLSSEHGEREKLIGRLGSLAARVDVQLGELAARVHNVEGALDNLKSARATVPDLSNKEPGAGTIEKPAAAEVRPSPPEDQSVRSEQNRTSPPETPARAKQSDGVPRGGSPLVEPVDQVGAISVPRRRAKLDPRKRFIGPPGCTQFHSFDPDSGTYRTFEGQRRPCQ